MRLEHTQPLAALRARRPAAVASAIFIAFLLLGVVTTVATAAPWNLAAWIGLAAQDANAADLAITKTASADTLVVGSPLTYTIVVANNGPITATGVVLTDNLPAEVTLVSAAHGSPSCVVTDGTVTCTLPDLVSGQSVTVTIETTAATAATVTNSASVSAQEPDNDTANNTAIATTTVVPPNVAPEASDQAVTTDEDTAVAITLVASDANGDALTYTIVTPPAHGTLSGAAPDLTYTPAPNFHGADSFIFQVNDGQVDSALATVSITVNALNDAPTLAPIADQTLDEGTTVEVAVTASDVDGDAITLQAMGLPPFATFTDHGDGTGTIVLSPGFDAAGPATQIEVIASDGALTASRTFLVTVNNVNRPPEAVSQTVVTDEDTAIGIALMGSDPDGDALAFRVVTPPAHGVTTGAVPNLTYIPSTNFHGADSFTYQANDGTVDSAIATVDITVNPVNDAPVLSAIGRRTMNENETLTINLSAVDVDGDAVQFAVTGLPAFGVFTDNGDGTGTIVLQPTLRDSGEYLFTVSVSDGQAEDREEVPLTVINVNEPPVVKNVVFTTYKDTPVEITLTASDPDGDPVSLSVVTPPEWGPLFGQGSKYVYAPATVFNGVDKFTYKANDGMEDSALGTVTIVVGVPAVEGYVCAGPNLITNGNFEAGFTEQGVGQGWGRFDNEGQVGYGFYDDQWPATVYDGAHSQLIEMKTGVGPSDADRYAGIYQVVQGLQPGKPYKFSLAGMLREDGSHPSEDVYRYRVEWGWLENGTDWTQVTNWQELPWDTVYARNAPGQFLTYTTTIKPPSEKMTLFLRVWKKWAIPDRELDVNLDGVTLHACWPEVAANHPPRPR